MVNLTYIFVKTDVFKHSNPTYICTINNFKIYVMKNLSKNIVMEVLGTSLLKNKNGIATLTNPNEEQTTLLKSVLNLVLLLLTLPAITALLLVWFELSK